MGLDILLECFTDQGDTLSLLNLTSIDCQEETVGSQKRKQKYDDAGT